MSTEGGRTPDPRDVDAEFARMLRDEGLELGPGQAPREPAAPETGPEEEDREEGWPFADDDADEPPSEESRRRARAAHPALGPRDAPPRELDDDEVLYGDFDPPDPDLPQPSSAVLWSWTAMLGGFVLVLAVALSASLPSLLGWAGGAAALGGMVSLLLRLPRRSREEGDDGAEL
jgi:hypothetical protein